MHHVDVSFVLHVFVGRIEIYYCDFPVELMVELGDLVAVRALSTAWWADNELAVELLLDFQLLWIHF